MSLFLRTIRARNETFFTVDTFDYGLSFDGIKSILSLDKNRFILNTIGGRERKKMLSERVLSFCQIGALELIETHVKEQFKTHCIASSEFCDIKFS